MSPSLPGSIKPREGHLKRKDKPFILVLRFSFTFIPCKSEVPFMYRDPSFALARGGPVETGEVGSVPRNIPKFDLT